MPVSSFRDLRVWQESLKLTVSVYKCSSQFPKHELYGLSQQIRRAAVSVPSNIAEGKGHCSNKDFVRFLLHARGLLLELQTQMLIAQELEYVSTITTTAVLKQAGNVGRALSGLINSMEDQVASRAERPTTNDQRRRYAAS